MRRRLDVEMVRRSLAGSRTEAAAAIRSGAVTVAGRPALKASTLVDAGDPIILTSHTRPFVSRGGQKLEAALERFGLEVTGSLALDAGASTGGFTDCLLTRGAAHVVAVDVGYGQLDWRLRQDPRVTLLERKNVRTLAPQDLPYRPDLVTVDLSFISLRLALPALVRCASEEFRLVLLVKPQFEAGRGEVGPGGVVSDPATWTRVLREITAACLDLGIRPSGVMASPLLGPAGNAEFLLAGGPDDVDSPVAPVADEAFDVEILAAVGEARALVERGGAGDVDRSAGSHAG